MRKKLLASLVASACTLSVSGPAHGQQFQEYGPEKVVYVYCFWGAGNLQVAVSQIEEVRWRDGIKVYDGKKFIQAHIGTYMASVKAEFDKRLGLSDNTQCEYESTPSYERRKPGTSFEAINGGTVHVTLKEVDPHWFAPQNTVENVSVLSLSQKKKPTAPSKPKPSSDVAKKAETKAVPSGPTPAEVAAEKHRAVEERNRAAQIQYEADLAERQRKVDEFNRLTAEMERKKAEQAAAAQAALAAHDAQLSAAAEAQRKHEADLAKYEQDVAAQKLRKGFDERHELGQASTDTDANRCVTSPETQLNASFKGNTAASVINGCGKPVDVRICLMTDKGWNCGVTYGLGSQQRWSHSSFNATGSVFSDARISGSSRPLASPK